MSASASLPDCAVGRSYSKQMVLQKLEEKKLGPSTCRFCRKCISVNALRTDVCFEDAWGPSMGLRRTGLGLRSLWRLCLRGTAKEIVRLRCVIRRRCGQACRGVRCGLRSTCGRGHIITSSQRGHENPRNQHNSPDRHRAFEVLCPQICIRAFLLRPPTTVRHAQPGT